MRDHQVTRGYPFVAEVEDVDVDDARTPAARPGAPTFSLHVLGSVQQLARCAGPFAFDDLVQETRLVRDTPWLGLDDVALAQNADASLAQAPPCSAQVACARAEIRAEPQIDDGQRFDQCPGRRIRSATRTARVIVSTSCTRTMSAPRRTAATTVAAVPSSRSVTGRSCSLPMKDFPDVPIRMGCPSSFSSSSLRMTSQFWSAVLPKPMPGSTITFSFGTPALTARAAAAARNRLISCIRSTAYSVPSWLCMRTIAHPWLAPLPATAGGSVSPRPPLPTAPPAPPPPPAPSPFSVSLQTQPPAD